MWMRGGVILGKGRIRGGMDEMGGGRGAWTLGLSEKKKRRTMTG